MESLRAQITGECEKLGILIENLNYEQSVLRENGK